MSELAPMQKALLLSMGLHGAVLGIVTWLAAPTTPLEPPLLWLDRPTALNVVPPPAHRTNARSRPVEPRLRPAAPSIRQAYSRTIQQPIFKPAASSPAGTSPPEALGSVPLTSEASLQPPTGLLSDEGDPAYIEQPLPSEAAPPSAGGHSSPAEASPDELAAYLSRLVSMLEARVQYPLQARRLQWEGRSVLRCTLTREGDVRQVEIASSSGRLLLDAAAIRALQQLGKLPPYPATAKEALTLEIPVTFKLN